MENLIKTADGIVDESPLPVSSSPALVAYQEAASASIRERLPEVTRVLLGVGVSKVWVAYDGSGDSGQIEGILCDNAQGKRFEPHFDGTLEDDLTGFFYDLIEARHGGWENDDGACGEFVWDVVADTLHHVHHCRFTEYDTTEHDGL